MGKRIAFTGGSGKVGRYMSFPISSDGATRS